jgi:hypothetical protein
MLCMVLYGGPFLKSSEAEEDEEEEEEERYLIEPA